VVEEVEVRIRMDIFLSDARMRCLFLRWMDDDVLSQVCGLWA
jgi:hypothetical protein